MRPVGTSVVLLKSRPKEVARQVANGWQKLLMKQDISIILAVHLCTLINEEQVCMPRLLTTTDTIQETFKIVTGIYDKVVSPNMLAVGPSYATRGLDYRKLGPDMIYENTISLTELLICGILCLVMLSLQNL